MLKKIFTLLFLLFAKGVFAERAMYVDDFDTIIESATGKTNLLQYAQNHGITYLILYDLHTVHNAHNLTMASSNQILANFIHDAKTNYGVTKIAAAGENAWFFQNRIIAYNNTRSVASEKFDVLGMEFEFWTPIFTNSGGAYCVDYLQPNGLSCDSTGAFAFCKSQLMQMRTMADASSHPVKVEMYVGWPNAGQMKIMADIVDRMLVHAYVTSPSTAFNYSLTRLQYYSSMSGVKNVSIIYSAEPNFMQPWLNANNMLSAENIYNTAYNAASGTWKSHVNLTGFTYFTYSMMTNISLPLQLIDFQGFSTNKNEHHLFWKIENAQHISHFEVEKSMDGTHFSLVEKVVFEPKNNFDVVLNNSNEAAYYRLKIVDNDARFDYSKSIFIAKNILQNSSILVFPNPSNGILQLANVEKNTPFKIYNAFGIVVFEGETNAQYIDLQHFTKGVYWLRANEKSVAFVLK